MPEWNGDPYPFDHTLIIGDLYSPPAFQLWQGSVASGEAISLVGATLTAKIFRDDGTVIATPVVAVITAASGIFNWYITDTSDLTPERARFALWVDWGAGNKTIIEGIVTIRHRANARASV